MTEQPNTCNSSDKKVSFTADYHPYLKTFYGLPFTQRISDLTGSRAKWEEMVSACQKEEGMSDEEANGILQMATIMEARYKLSGQAIRQTIEKLGIKRGLELAAGFSQRGLEFTRDYPGLVYVESDISDGFKQKPELIRRVADEEGVAMPRGLSFVMLDAQKRGDYKSVLNEFFPNGQAMWIYAEGLFAYWDEEKKANLLGIARDIFTSRPGSKLITPDLSMHNEGRIAMFEHINGYEKLVNFIVKRTKRDYDSLAFPNEQATTAFLDRQRWKYIGLTLGELGVSLNSPDALKIPLAVRTPFVADINRHMKAWVLTPDYT